MPQGSSTSTGRFVKVINEVIKGLEGVAAYLDGIIVFDPTPSAHTTNIRALFEGQQKRSHKLSLAKAKIGATTAGGFDPNSDKVAALAKMPIPTKKSKYVHSLKASSIAANSLPTSHDVFAPSTHC